MNLTKAAPSAPVKKAAREDPRILPGGLLILFFLLLAVGEAEDAQGDCKQPGIVVY